MTKTLIKAPFKADHVGSLLRPEIYIRLEKIIRKGKLLPNNFVK